MAAESSVTWTHCSVRYEVTWDKRSHPRGRAYASARVSVRTGLCNHADAPMRSRGHKGVCADASMLLPVGKKRKKMFSF
jgi:hypothetical protein